MSVRIAGQEAIRNKGWIKAHKWLLLRRISQLGILSIFLLGPVAGIWIVNGSLSASMTLKVLPLTDPLILLQSFAAGHAIAAQALSGALIVTVFYAIIGGRVYCSWVCPVNMVTDAAGWLNRRLDVKKSYLMRKNLRYGLLVAIIVLAIVTGTITWEWINPVTIMHRGLLFGMGMGWFVVGAIVFLDVFAVRSGWCGHICPVGAFYSLLGKISLLRVSAARREQCTDCLDCYTVCPEPQVISPALKGDKDQSSLILSGNCINCGRCIDICPHEVFQFSKRF